MFNKSYQLRAVRKAGGGRKVAEDALLRLPWAGIFEPWRPFVAVAAATEKNQGKPGKIKQYRNRRQRLEQAGQTRLFPENGAQKFTPLEILDTPVKNFTPESARPLFDLFPEAYE